MGDLGSATTRRPRSRLAALGLLGALLLGAAPARAGGGFERGFENELGRIAAREVVRFGKVVLMGGHRPFYGARWAAAYPAPGYEEYRGYPLPPRRPVRYRAATPPPVYPVAVPVYPAAASTYPAAPPVYPAAPPSYAAAPPSYAASAPAPCEHTAAEPYEERIVWERYERVIQRPAPPPQDYEPYGTYDQQARY